MSEQCLRVIVGVPSGPFWHAKFGLCLGSLMARFAIQQVPGWRQQELRVSNIRSSILPRNRMDLMRVAETEKVDYLLMLDCDHTFPPDLLHHWIPLGKQIIAANCVTKQLPSQPTARALDTQRPFSGRPVFSDPESTGLEQVWRVGCGVILLHRTVIAKISHNAWEMRYRPEIDTYQGEDWTFAEACEKADIPIYIDHDMSKMIGHEGMFEYKHEFVGDFK